MTRLAMPPSHQFRAESTPHILGIGTANPPVVPQALSLELALELGCFDDSQKSWMKRLFLRGGIEARCSVLASDGTEDQLDVARQFYTPAKTPDDRGPTTHQRMARYAADAPALAEQSAHAALTQSQTSPGQITHLVTASCTGFFSPGLDAYLIERLNLSRNVQRLHVGFMGCHAAFNALAAARDAVAADPRRVLVCCVELCTLHLAYGTDPGKLVANSLFADGAASVVVGHDANGAGSSFQVDDFSSCMLADCGDAMTWKIGDHGFEMQLSPGVPQVIREQLSPWCTHWLARHGLEVADIHGWAIHPGGPKILGAVSESLRLVPEDLRFSRDILSRFGNMSSATVLFILRQMMSHIDGPIVAIGLGPGLVAEGMLLNSRRRRQNYSL